MLNRIGVMFSHFYAFIYVCVYTCNNFTCVNDNSSCFKTFLMLLKWSFLFTYICGEQWRDAHYMFNLFAVSYINYLWKFIA